METKKVFLLLNGEAPRELPNTNQYDLICVTDGAYQVLKKHNIIPDFVSGDFDSLASLPEDVKTIHTPNQDFTDFDKILQILFEKGFKTIDVYGASGEEQDHFLGNLHTAIQWKEKLVLTFFDNYGYYFLANKTIEILHANDKTISLIPFPSVTNINTKGLVYPLKKESLVFGERIGTRNKANSDKVVISHEAGNLFVFVNDKV